MDIQQIMIWLIKTLASSVSIVGFTLLLILAMAGIALLAIKHGRIIMLKIELAWSEPREELLNKVLKLRKQGSIIARIYKWQELKEKEKERNTLKLEKKLLKEEKIPEPSLLILPNREK
jgi:hypothetical protein